MKSDAEIRARNIKMAAGRMGIMVRGGTHFQVMGQSQVPIAGAKVTIAEGEASKRVTLTRVALAGPFSLLMKKSNTKMFVTIEGTDGTGIVLKVSAGKMETALQLSMLLSEPTQQ